MKPKICIITLGCKVNQYESDNIASQLTDFKVVTKLEYADIYIVNTCAITGYAEKKSRYQISRIVRFDPNARIIVCGCASELDVKQFNSPNIIQIYGTDKSKILTEIKNMYKELPCKPTQKPGNRNRVFIKAQDGCDNFCSYCIVPYLRGRSQSREIGEVIGEINALPELVREVVLTGIDLSSFNNLNELCKQVDNTGRVFRLSSIEARIITPDFLQTLKRCKNFCPSFHVPLQSGSDDVLKSMNRRYTTEEYLEKINLVRSIFPNAQITTDIICGFPTETEHNFNETIETVKQAKFLHAHIFPYSARSGTVAAKLQQLQSSIITERTKKLIYIQNQIKKDIVKTYTNKTINVLFEYHKNGYSYGTSREYLSVKAKGNYAFDWQEITINSDTNQIII